MDPDQNPIDIQTFPCPDILCPSRPFKRKNHLLVHLREVHDQKFQSGNEPGDNMKKRRTSAEEPVSGFSTGSGFEHLSSTNEDPGILRGSRKVHDQPPGIISWQNAVKIPETVDPLDADHGIGKLSPFQTDAVDLVDWNLAFRELSPTNTDPWASVNEPASGVFTGHPWTFEVENQGRLEEPFKLLPQQNLLNPVVEEDTYLGSMMHGEGAEMNGLNGESDDLTKSKMISALQEKYAELKQIDEQIRMLEELKTNRSHISKDITGLEGNYRDLCRG